MKTYTPNSIVFNRNGARAKYVTNSQRGHVVMPEMRFIGDEGEDNYEWSDVAIWHGAFRTEES